MTTTPAYDTILHLAHEIATQLVDIPGVRAVVLGGSWARGVADASSDIDLGIYYDPAAPPELSALRGLAARIDVRHLDDLVTDFGAWGQWVNGGAWLTVNEQRVDWLFRDLAQVRAAINECLSGRAHIHYQAGHPHGFSTHIYMAEVAVCQVLVDPRSDLAVLKSMTQPYPARLKHALIENSLWEAGFTLQTTLSAARRGDVFHVSGSLFRCAACLTQALFALNERYWLNEKNALKLTSKLPLCPHEFEQRVRRVLAHPGVGASGLEESVQQFALLVKETQALCE
jgi:predicted nucleotidyltransferase